MNAQQAGQLHQQAARHPRLKVMEAFMYRHHPQWAKARQLVDEGAIGELRSVHVVFTYHNMNANDIRNRAEAGGGGLMDIGCYCISVSRFLFGDEPQRVCGTLEYDQQFKTDRLASGVLAFAMGTASFTCSTQAASRSRVGVFGTSGSLEIEVPFIPRPDETCTIIHYSGSQRNEIFADPCDQYTIQGDLFSQAILNDTPVPTPLEDAVANMRVIDAVVESHKKGSWVVCPPGS
jgi:predicted dehydrogenase